MPHDIGVKARWMKLSEALDTSWTSLYHIGGVLEELIKMRFSSSYLTEVKSTEEHQQPRAAALSKNSEEYADNLDFVQTNLRALKNMLDCSQDAFVGAERELREEISAIQPEVLALLDALHGRPWRPHFRRFYLDSLRELPSAVRGFDMAFYDDDCVPPQYRRTTLPASLKELLTKAELHPPFQHWHRLIRRAQIFAADLHSIRDEIGGELSDGPYPGFRWIMDGEVKDDTMLMSAWKLVDFLWRKQGQVASYTECAEPVFGDRERYIDDDKIGHLRKYANKFFESNSIPLVVRTKKGHVLLESINWPIGEGDQAQTSQKNLP